MVLSSQPPIRDSLSRAATRHRAAPATTLLPRACARGVVPRERRDNRPTARSLSAAASQSPASWPLQDLPEPHSGYRHGAPQARNPAGVPPTYRGGRFGCWEQRARCDRATPECIEGQHATGDRFGHPPTAGRVERPPASRATEALRLAAAGARREGSTAPGAGAQGNPNRPLDGEGNRGSLRDRARVHGSMSGWCRKQYQQPGSLPVAP
jgi:hypothetical protein